MGLGPVVVVLVVILRGGVEVAGARGLAFALPLVGVLVAGRAGSVVEDGGLGSPEEPHSGSIHVICFGGRSRGEGIDGH